MKMTAKFCMAGLAFLLGACGKVGPLVPTPGQAAPAKAYGSDKVAGSEELMQASEQARPGRSDELIRRSERRTDDPFDLPPGTQPKPVDKAPDASEAVDPAKPE